MKIISGGRRLSELAHVVLKLFINLIYGYSTILDRKVDLDHVGPLPLPSLNFKSYNWILDPIQLNLSDPRISTQPMGRVGSGRVGSDP